MAVLLDAFDAVLSDLDGVVYAGPHAIPGAVESLNRASAQGVAVAYVTNNASRSVQTVAEHLRELGLDTDAEHVVSSAQAAADLARRALETRSAGSTSGHNVPGSGSAGGAELGEGPESPEKAGSAAGTSGVTGGSGRAPRVQICGAVALADCARDAGLTVVAPGEDPDAVLQGFNPTMTWEDLAEAAYALADPHVLWVASNTDLTIPKERGIAPGNGTLVAAVATATRRTPLVAGKPEAAIFHTVIQRLGVSRPVVVGDRLDTDILGATRAGLPGIAVMTGVQTWEDLLNARTEERPAYVLPDLTGLFRPYPRIEVTEAAHGTEAILHPAGETTGGEGAQDGPAAQTLVRAVAQGDAVRIHAPEGSVDGWRAGMAAWWAAHPQQDVPTAAEIVWETP